MSSEPLSPEDWEQLVDTVSQPAARVPLTVIGGTGLPAVEFLHLNEDWVEWPGDHPTAPDYPIINIPESEPCRRKKVPRGHNSSVELIERNEPCFNCKSRDVPEPKFIRRREDLPHTVPVVDPQAVDALTWWFNRYDTIPWRGTYTTLNTVAKNRLGRKITHTALRRTFFARAAKMGLDLELIATSAGITQTSLKEKGSKPREILSTYGDYDTLPKEQLHCQDYLEVLTSLGPATTPEIADKVNRARETVLHNLNQYADKGLVKAVKETKTGTKVWKATTPSTEIKCRHTGCERAFSRLQARTQHEKEKHG